MAWETDHDPIAYLDRRLKYYQFKYKRLPKIYRKNKLVRDKYTEQDILNKMEHIQERILQYTGAIAVLKEFVTTTSTQPGDPLS